MERVQSSKRCDAVDLAVWDSRATKATMGVGARILAALQAGREPDPRDVAAAVDLALVGGVMGGVP